MFQSMSFLHDNWLQILLFGLSIVIGLAITYTFYRLQRRQTVSAEAERKKQAKEELMEVVESYFINKQILSEEALDSLIAATEREYQVDLGPTCSPIAVLQDVNLSLQRSRHLDVSQKSSYVAQIEELLSRITTEHKQMRFYSRRPVLLLKEIESAIQDDKKDSALKGIETLKRTLVFYLDRSPTSDNFPTEFLRAALVGILTSGLAFALFSSIYEKSNKPLFPDLKLPQQPAMFGILLGIAFILVIVLAGRLLLASRPSKSK